LTKFGFYTLFRTPEICKTLLNVEVMSFFSSYELLHTKYAIVFTSSCIALSIAILLLIGTCHLNVITLDFSEGIFNQNCSVMLCKINNYLLL